MSQLRRQPRPLSRDASSLRDDRLFIVACDDTYAPKQYFDFFQLTRVRITVVPTTDGECDAAHVLERLLIYEHEDYDELWMLLDTDHYVQGTHLASFVRTLFEARRHDVKVALSRPSFELWLLLHHVEETAVVDLADAREVEERLRAELGQYNKAKLRREHYPPARVREAYFRAQNLDASVPGGEVPERATTRVYRLWKAIVSEALPTQLRPELRALRESLFTARE